jgi:hypothetical protein
MDGCVRPAPPRVRTVPAAVLVARHTKCGTPATRVLPIVREVVAGCLIRHNDVTLVTTDQRIHHGDERCGAAAVAWHFQWNLTPTARAEHAVEATLSGAALKAYRDAGYEDDPPIML